MHESWILQWQQETRFIIVQREEYLDQETDEILISNGNNWCPRTRNCIYLFGNQSSFARIENLLLLENRMLFHCGRFLISQKKTRLPSVQCSNVFRICAYLFVSLLRWYARISGMYVEHLVAADHTCIAAYGSNALYSSSLLTNGDRWQ